MIAKVRQTQASQVTPKAMPKAKPLPVQAPAPIEQEIDESLVEPEEDFDDEDDVEEEALVTPPVQMEKPILKKVKPEPTVDLESENMKKAQAIVSEIDMLHNNGVYRRELLVSLGELNANIKELVKLLKG